jgi:predicted nucleotidyltransferase
MPKHSPITREAMAVYRATLQHRAEEEQRERVRRQEHAWELAQRAATLLKEVFGAKQVLAFGSLVHGYWFSKTSDVDLAVWGLKDEDYLVAVARLQDLSSEFKIDLVAMERCKPELRDAIMKVGNLL